MEIKLATSSSLEGIRRSVRQFYCMPDSHEPLVKSGSYFHVISESGKKLTPVVEQTKRGFIFGIK